MLSNKKVLITGGSRGLGLQIAEALVKHDAQVTIIGRNAEILAQVRSRMPVAVLQGDVTDSAFARQSLKEVQPDILILNAGETPVMKPLETIRWDEFTNVWNTDVQAGLYWMQAALNMPLMAGSRVVVMSSGAALSGSPLSGSYAGAKKMLWYLTSYANQASQRLKRNILFQSVLPWQIMPETALGRSAAEAYAAAKGISVEQLMAPLKKPLSPALVGELITRILTYESYRNGEAFALKGEEGIILL